LFSGFLVPDLPVSFSPSHVLHFPFAFPRFSILLLLSFYFILLSSATAQVKIKERVEIKPSSNIVITQRLNKTTSNMTTIRMNQYQRRLKTRYDYDKNCYYEQDWSVFNPYKNKL
jgi:hypothetical protein